MNGKERCKVLKSIRQDIARENQIPFELKECTHTGDCLGTCPRCESEMRYLEREVKKKQKLGKKVVLAGISAATMLSMTGCTASTGESIPEIMRRLTEEKKEASGDDFELEWMGEVEADYNPDTDSGDDLEADPDIYELDGDVVYIDPSEGDERERLDGEVVCIDPSEGDEIIRLDGEVEEYYDPDEEYLVMDDMTIVPEEGE